MRQCDDGLAEGNDKGSEVMKELRSGVIEVGVRHPDRKLFDEFMPLPNGTSYNSYLVKGSEKTALIDTVDPEFTSVLMQNIAGQKIDYVIANHAEQDHSGSLPAILERFPECRLVCNEKCMELLTTHLHIAKERFLIIKDEEELSLGDKTLKFIFTPWVHWPETMCTYLKEEKILFTCDFFGAHDAHFTLFVEDEKRVYDAAKRYYAEIMMPYRGAVNSNMEKLRDLPIDIIAPSHGPVHNNPKFILGAYADWASDSVKREVIIAYISMHGSTKVAADRIAGRVMKTGIPVKKINLTEVSVGELAIDMVDAAAIIVGSPKFLAGLHPTVEHFLYFMNVLHPKAKLVGFFGSSGWGNKVEFKEKLENLKAEFLPILLVKGLPNQEDLATIDRFSDEIIKRV
ncbi:MAG: FprA family A-type flavoprotein [Nanoarchaeota archaeon]